MVVYEFLYCSCIFESGYVTVSMHKTKIGAYKAMRQFITSAYDRWYNERILIGKWAGDKFAEHERWGIKESKILD